MHLCSSQSFWICHPFLTQTWEGERDSLWLRFTSVHMRVLVHTWMVRLITYKDSFKSSGDHCLLHTVSVSPRFFDSDPSSSVYCFVIISSNWGGRFENVWNPLSSHRGKWSTVPSFTRGIPEWGADDGESGIPDSGFCGWLIAVLLALLYREDQVEPFTSEGHKMPNGWSYRWSTKKACTWWVRSVPVRICSLSAVFLAMLNKYCWHPGHIIP